MFDFGSLLVCFNVLERLAFGDERRMLLRVGAESMGLFGRSICSSPLRGSMVLLVFLFLSFGVSPDCTWGSLSIFFILFSVGFSHSLRSCAPCEADFVRRIPFSFFSPFYKKTVDTFH